jgi:hypothetical protein
MSKSDALKSGSNIPVCFTVFGKRFAGIACGGHIWSGSRLKSIQQLFSTLRMILTAILYPSLHKEHKSLL